MAESSSRPEATQPDLTGKALGDYILVRRLGRGGMADVYLAQQKSLRRPVALKVLKSELAKDKSYVKRFRREAQAAAALTQANIVQIYEVGECDGVHFIAQEYVRGQNLRQYLNRHGAVEPILAVSIIRQVAAALQKAAEHGVIHRDIKPENIMLAPNGEVKVTDFGLARVVDDNRTDLTQIGITLGTPLYMSPEQVEGRRVDPRSDIYSLGITSYQMLAGHPPFDAETALALAVHHVKSEPVPLEKVRPDVPAELCRLVHKMMAKAPEDRFQDSSHLAREIRKIDIDVDQNWESLVEKLAAEDTDAQVSEMTVPHSHFEVTKQLESVMTGHLRSWWASPAAWIAIAVVLLVGTGLGAALAMSRPRADTLNVETAADGSIPREKTVYDQYRRGYWNAVAPNQTAARIEQGWLAVGEYFPPDEKGIDTDQHNERMLYANRAAERLGEFYLQQSQWNKAMQVYSRLADLPETETRLRVVGKAGQVIVHFERKEDILATRLLPEIELQMDLLSEYLREQIVVIRDVFEGGAVR